MKYVLPISYQGNERSSVEAAELAKDDKSRLAKFAEQFDGTMSFANPVNPRAFPFFSLASPSTLEK